VANPIASFQVSGPNQLNDVKVFPERLGPNFG
jgi:hypothetical protein